MKPSADQALSGEREEEGWDAAVLVWNATVARIPAPSRASTPDGTSPRPAPGRPQHAFRPGRCWASTTGWRRPASPRLRTVDLGLSA